MGEDNKSGLTVKEKALLSYEKERDEMFYYLFDYLYSDETITANISYNIQEGINDFKEELEWNLRDAIKYDLFDKYFGILYSKLTDFFEVQHPELKYDFRNDKLFYGGYKTLIYFSVGKSIVNIVKNIIEQIPEFVNNNDKYKLSVSSDVVTADKGEGLKIIKVFTEMKNQSTYHLYLTKEEVSWFIEEHLEDLLQVLELVADKIGNLKTRSTRDKQILEKTFELINSKDPRIKYTHKNAISEAWESLVLGVIPENELLRLVNIFKQEKFKRDHKIYQAAES